MLILGFSVILNTTFSRGACWMTVFFEAEDYFDQKHSDIRMLYWRIRHEKEDLITQSLQTLQNNSFYTADNYATEQEHFNFFHALALTNKISPKSLLVIGQQLLELGTDINAISKSRFTPLGMLSLQTIKHPDDKPIDQIVLDKLQVFLQLGADLCIGGRYSSTMEVFLMACDDDVSFRSLINVLKQSETFYPSVQSYVLAPENAKNKWVGPLNDLLVLHQHQLLTEELKNISPGRTIQRKI